MTVYAGTSGYAYKEWKGSFYPDDLKNDDMLSYYGSQLGAVEINNTFYRMPREKVITAWTDAVPTAFRFVLKASRRITHFGRLKNVGDELQYFLQVTTSLEHHRGPTLFQLPPNFKADLERLTGFLALLPDGWPAAFEFRHDSWFTEAVYAALRERNAALVVADTEDGTTPVEATADWGYLRLRREDYPDDELATWAETVSGAGWKDAYVFFKHEDGATGPRLAREFAARFA